MMKFPDIPRLIVSIKAIIQTISLTLTLKEDVEIIYLQPITLRTDQLRIKWDQRYWIHSQEGTLFVIGRVLIVLIYRFQHNGGLFAITPHCLVLNVSILHYYHKELKQYSNVKRKK